MKYFEVGHAPTLVPHVHRHDAEPLCLEFAVDSQRTWAPYRRIRRAVRKAREDEPIAVDIGADEQHRAADRVEPHEIRPAAQIVEMNSPVIPPGVAIEARAAKARDTMGMYDVSPGGDEALDQIPWIIDYIDIEPQHPILLRERSKQQMISRPGEDLSTGDLEGVGPTSKTVGNAEIEVFLPDLGTGIAAAQMAEPLLDPFECPVIAIAFEKAERN